jgi:hypothetical protein
MNISFLLCNDEVGMKESQLIIEALNTPTPMLTGASIAVLMAVPEGEIRSSALVRNVVPKEGMGVQLVETKPEDLARLNKLVTRLLRNNPPEQE